MSVSEEVLLMGLIVGLYLYDSALLLCWNEGVISPIGKNYWRIAFGPRFRLRGRELFLPNPFFPHRPLFRLALQISGDAGDVGIEWPSRRNRSRYLKPFMLGIAISLFVILPLGLFTRAGDLALLAAVVFLYLNIFVSLIWLGLNKREFSLSTRRFIRIAFDVIVCSPFALNLVRRLSLEDPIQDDLAVAAKKLQAPADWESTRRDLIARLDEEIEAESDDSIRGRALQERRKKLLGTEI